MVLESFKAAARKAKPDSIEFKAAISHEPLSVRARYGENGITEERMQELLAESRNATAEDLQAILDARGIGIKYEERVQKAERIALADRAKSLDEIKIARML